MEESQSSKHADENHLLLQEAESKALSVRRQALCSYWWYIALVFLALLSNLFTIALLGPHKKNCGEDARVVCEDIHVKEPSPLHTLDRQFYTKTFEPFSYTASEFTQHPSVGDVDTAWDSLGLTSGHFLIPASEAERFALKKGKHASLPASILGEEYFIVMTDAMHQLHCLNEVRKALWYNRDWYLEHQEQAVREIHIAHTDHCVDALRERLMCLSDVTMLPAVWINRPDKVVPDFEREHKCHNFEALRDWTYKNQMPEIARNYTFPAGPETTITHLPGKDELYERLGLNSRDDGS